MKKAKEKQYLPIEILRNETTNKLNPSSGNLEYEIGKHTETGEAHIRISNNSFGGYFSSEWLPISAIQASLENHKKLEIAFGSSSLRSSFQHGKSANNASFLAAVLRNEGLITPHKTKKFQHHISIETNKWPERLLNKKHANKSAVTNKSS